jgi:hypothetical protein
MKPLTFADYKKEVQDYAGTVILFFTAPWAKPALKTANFLQSTNLNLKIFSIDFDNERELVAKYSIRELPFLVCLTNGIVKTMSEKCETEADLYDITGLK